MLFPFGRLVYGKDFVGRKEDCKRFMMFIENGENMILIAPRRMGKSSFVWNILQDLKDDFYIGSVDIFEIQSKLHLAQQITQSLVENRCKGFRIIEKMKAGLQNLMRQIEIKHTIEDFDFILKFAEANVDEEILLRESLDFIEKIALKDKKRLVFFFDEFGDIDKLDGLDLQKLFRSVFQRHKHAQYIFVGSQESLMKKTFVEPSAPFYRFGRIEFFDTIRYEDYAPYIKRKLKSVNIKIDDPMVEYIYNFTRGHPYYTQQLCQNIYYIVNSLKKEQVEKGDVNEAVENSLAYEQPYLDTLWANFLQSKEQLFVIMRLLDPENNSVYSHQNKGINVYRALDNLTKKGVIKKLSAGKYELIDPLFREYLLRKKKPTYIDA